MKNRPKTQNFPGHVQYPIYGKVEIVCHCAIPLYVSIEDSEHRGVGVDRKNSSEKQQARGAFDTGYYDLKDITLTYVQN